MSTSAWIAIGLGAIILLGGLGRVIRLYFKTTSGTKVDFKLVELKEEVLLLTRALPKATKEIRAEDISEVLIYTNMGTLGSSAHIDSPDTDKYKEYTLTVSAEDLVAFCKRNNIACIGEERETGSTVDLNIRIDA
jgi:hypothetical protein